METSQDSDRAIGGNSLALKTSWAGCDQETSTKNIAAESLTIASDSTSQFSRSNSMTQSINSLKSPVDYHSYNALLRKHRKTRELDWNDVWERFESSIGITGNDSGVVVSSTSNLNTSNSDESEEDAVNGNSTGVGIKADWILWNEYAGSRSLLIELVISTTRSNVDNSCYRFMLLTNLYAIQFFFFLFPGFWL